MLREALRSLGLPRAAARGPRAIQFGCRIVKHANLRDFGSGRRANAMGAGYVRLGALPARGAAAAAAAAAGQQTQEQEQGGGGQNGGGALLN